MAGYDWKEGRYIADESTPVETASGTTSPDNSNSSKAPYVVGCLAAVFLIVFALMATSCVALMSFGAIADGLSNSSSYHEISYEAPSDNTYSNPNSLSEPNDTLDVYDLIGLEDLDDEELFNTLDNLFGIDSLTSTEDVHELINYLDTMRNTSPTKDEDGSSQAPLEHISTSQALALNLSVYGSSISDEVSASAYSGASDEVVEYVRGFCALDKQATDEVVLKLRAAGRDETKQGEQLGYALERATAAYEEIRAYALPENLPSEIHSDLEEAREEASERWRYIVRLCEILAEEEVSSIELTRVDADIFESTADAAEELVEALSDSARTR